MSDSRNYDSSRFMYNVALFAKENQAKRLLLLRQLYDSGMGHKCLTPVTLLVASDWDEFEIMDTAEYLSEEELVRMETDNENGFPSGVSLCLTHKGILEVERTINHPTEATEYFPAPIVQNFHGPVGSVQSGEKSIANTTQNLDETATSRRGKNSER